MRTRILKKLRELATGNEKDISTQLLTDLNIDEKKLQQRAAAVVSSIIHDLSSVSISTIDRFTYRLLRTFAFELNINTGARLRLDADAIARQTVDNLLEIAVEPGNELLNHYLTSYVHTQMRNNKSWFIVKQLQSMVKRLHHENDREAVHQLTEHGLETFTGARDTLKSKRNALRACINREADNLKTAFEDVSDHHSDISHIGDFYGLFKKIKNQAFEIPGKRLITNRKNAFLKNKSKAEADDLLPLSTAFDSFLQLTQKEIASYNMLLEIEKHFDAVALMGSLQKAYDKLREEENFINIGEFQSLIQELTGSDTPDYMFERLGDRYSWFFIDEFQDTSSLQWNNLKTLAQHAMANNGGSMLVGDPKQSIYRWRGSNPELFINIYSDKDPDRFSILPGNKTVERYQLNQQTLETNYRSGKALVEFVHDLFIHKGKTTSASDIAYSEVTKRAHKPYTGYLKLAFYDKEYTKDTDELLREQTLSTIQEALDDGFELRDICVLTRSNKDGRKVAQWINEARNEYNPPLNVISNESFILENQPGIRCVVAAIGHLLFPEVKGYRFDLLQALYEMSVFSREGDSTHKNIKQRINLSSTKFEAELQTIFPSFSLKALRSLPLVETCIRLMQMFHLSYGKDVYLQAFIQAVRNRAQESPIDEHEFLQWWTDSQREIISIDVPENLNAVNITTLHKAKGLEWPVVIMPYTNWSFHAKQSTMWFADNERTPLGKTQVDIKEENDKKTYPEAYNQEVEKKRGEDAFDNTNMLYVAFTRASQRLYAFSIEPRSVKNSVYEFLVNKLNVDMSAHHYKLERGEKQPKQHSESENTVTERHIKHVDTGGAAPVLRVGRKYSPGINDLPAIARGNTIHDALQQINLNPQNIDPVLDDMERRQRITREERPSIRHDITRILDTPVCRRIYEEAKELLPEHTLLLPGGEILRPDLVAHLHNGDVLVIDYKTGAVHSKHHEQLQRYIAVLQQMGYNTVSGELIYIQ